MTAPAPDEKMRLFVALEMPATWTLALGELQDKMRAALTSELGVETPRLRWTRPEGIHLTLKFLGETSRHQSAPIDRALRDGADGVTTFNLSLGKIGSFGDRRGPRVVYVDVEGETDPLLALAKKVDEALVDAGFARERRPFQPHLTLARFPEEIALPIRERLAAAVASVRTPRPGPHRFRELSLMRSYLERGSARYGRVRSYKLI